MFLLAALAAGACSTAPPQASFGQSRDRNILLVTIDTLRADALGCDGGPARTPNIDALAASGVRFTFAHAHSVVTLPSHASILTGEYPFEHGVRDNSGYRLPAAVGTIATRLHAAGFATGAFVAAAPLDPRYGLAAGFDLYDGRFDDAGGGASFTLPERPATIVVARAMTWIQTQTRPWFAWVHVYEPHAPYRPPPPFDTEYAGRPYYGEVAAVDRALGPLFEIAKQAPRSTVIVLTGDHGEALGDHGETTHGLFAYESTLHVPLIVAETRAGGAGGAGRLGTVSDAPVRHIDILPTILDMLDMPAAANLPGHSLRTDADRRSATDRPSYFEAMSAMLDYGGAPLAGVLAGRDKYIRVPIPELYDLASDPAERRNLIDRPDAAARRRALEASLAAFAAAAPGAPRPEDADAAARLRSLGYLSPGAAPKGRYTEADDPKRLANVDRELHEAVALGEDGHLPEAIDRYKRVLAERPALTAAARHLAFAYWRLGDASHAISTLQAARPTASADVGLSVQLATYLAAAGRRKESLALLEEAARPGADLDALNALGLAYARDNRTADALGAFNRSLQLDPDNATTHENIAAIQLDAGRLDQARAEFTRAIELNPRSAQAHSGLALALMKQNDRGGALAEWKKAVAIDPADFDALYNLGVQLARDGQTAEARPYLERFARTAPPAAYGRELRNVEALLQQRQ
jgi:arylsulfatase A-like enzyme/Tfp pilus assembly protein PilF